jgi:aspartate-semialdehyde dehydrogenase
VRIPTIRAHSESVTIETEKEINPQEVKNLLKKSP